MALPRDAEADGSAVVDVLGAARRAVRCAAEPRNEFPGRSEAVPAKEGKRSFIDPFSGCLTGAF